MGNNGNCDTCAGNNARNQMDMRRQKAMMYDRYAHGQMMPRTQNSCDPCGNVRTQNSCDPCGNARTQNACDTCGNVRTQNSCDSCGNGRAGRHDELRGMPLAMGYVPWQNFECTYEPMQGLRAGTIFPELDKPFYGRRGMR